MKLAVLSVWLFLGVLLAGASAQAQPTRGASGGSGGFSSGSRFGSTAGQAHNPSITSKSLPNVPTRAVQRPGSQTQFVLPPAVPPPARSLRSFGGSSRFENKFGTGHIDWRRRIDFRRHRHFPRSWRFVVVQVPGFIGTTITTPYIPVTPFIAGTGWSEQRLPDYSSGAAPVRGSGRLAPFDPTPQELVERMLALAGVTASDVVYDLGAGDGRVVVTAAKNYGARAVGVEVDGGLVKLARENVRRERLEHLAEIRQQDFMGVDLSQATVVTLYLSYDGNLAVRPKLMRELKPGARIVSYTFDMAEWQPKVAESYRDAAGERHMLYMWQMSDPLVFSN
jgi:SAM-dependent methyltransferase